MDWKLAMKEERAALMRIVALLFALADLAESASRRSALVRGLVLWVLRRGEAVAWDFVTGKEVLPSLMPVSPARGNPAEAMRLAQSFRYLAYELECQARLAFVVDDASYDDSGQVGLARFGVCRTLNAGDFLDTLRRLVFTNIAPGAAYATGPPDTS